ncbi:hypothetical protein M3Y98_00798100 [Aphelenchoides besseyi]|nr:hypothetical protein M3Y98_00798100 [Aphelenchoides besseyi]
MDTIFICCVHLCSSIVGRFYLNRQWEFSTKYLNDFELSLFTGSLIVFLYLVVIAFLLNYAKNIANNTLVTTIAETSAYFFWRVLRTYWLDELGHLCAMLYSAYQHLNSSHSMFLFIGYGHKVVFTFAILLCNW